MTSYDDQRTSMWSWPLVAVPVVVFPMPAGRDWAHGGAPGHPYPVAASWFPRRHQEPRQEVPRGSGPYRRRLRELETHGYLRRTRERTPRGHIVTRTVSCNQPGRRTEGHADRRTRPEPESKPRPEPHPGPAPHHAPAPENRAPEPTRLAHPTTAAPGPPKKHAPRKPLPAVPQPAYKGPGLLQAATDLLAGLRRLDPDLLLSACDTAHLAPGVAAWLERDVSPTAVRHALISDLPPEGMRRPAAFLAHRLTAQLPPPAPYRAPSGSSPVRHPLRNCDGCERAFRGPEPGRCGECRRLHNGPAPGVLHPSG
ncbi:hypothetical protein QFZ49_000287 [Streptomyces turgidiscabies]|uniref:Helix-turn-helix domain-containing protein n=1 Tax=Streptomyces turgidiscabies TaxID=85558 RepID=A0ABU0REI2_9ACTN|nr:hypothetical protein [Streptomyces turgidiscabies]